MMQLHRQFVADAGAGARDNHHHVSQVSRHCVNVVRVSDPCIFLPARRHQWKTRATMCGMFTGIVERTVRIVGVAQGPKFRRINVAVDWTDVKLGESIAINGVCLTVAEMADGMLGFDAIKETLDRTNLGLLSNGDEVHVERALRVGDRIDGHFVLGHVDGTSRILDQKANAQEWRTTLEAPDHLVKYLAPKGS